MRRYLFSLIIILSVFQNIIFSQGFIPDSYLQFLLPKKNDSISYYSISEFNNQSKYWKSSKNSPDIKIIDYSIFDSVYQQYINRIDTCIGLININYNSNNNDFYSECIETKLTDSLINKQGYHLEVKVKIDNSYLGLENDNKNPSNYSIYLQVQFVNTVSAIKSKSLVLKPLKSNLKNNWKTYYIDFYIDDKNKYDKIILGYIDDQPPNSLNKSIKYYILLKSIFLYKIDDLPPKNKLSKLLNSNLSVYFQKDKSTLTLENVEQIVNKINALNILQIDSIKIYGHASEEGDYSYNMDLSVKRATSIEKFIEKRWDVNHIIFNTKGFSFKYSKKYKWQEKGRKADVIFHLRNEDIMPWYVISDNCSTSEQLSYIGKIKNASIFNNDPDYLKIKNKYLKEINKKHLDAKRFIYKKTEDLNVLLINEAHHIPYHRKFAMDLLDTLYKNGFRFLAVEALAKSEDINSLNYKDPIFKAFLKKAKKLGFHLVAYDNNFNVPLDFNKENIDTSLFNNIYIIGNSDILFFNSKQNKRDYNEFLNLKKIFQKVNEKNKLFVYCGYGHAQTKRVGFWFPLAYYFQKYFGNSFLSIDQVTLNDCKNKNNNDLIKLTKPSKSVVLTDKNGIFIKREYDPLTNKYIKPYQVQILHPQDRFSPKRKCKKTVKIQLQTYYKFPVLIMIFEYNSNPFSDIAFSIEQIDDLKNNKNICVPNSKKYKIVIKDRNNKIVYYGINN